MSDATERLAAAIHRVIMAGDAVHFDDAEFAAAILAADPDLAAALELGLAWQAAEARGHVLSVSRVRSHGWEWRARAMSTDRSHVGVTAKSTVSAATALRALAEKLRQ